MHGEYAGVPGFESSLLVVNNCVVVFWLSIAVLKLELWSAGVLIKNLNKFDFFLPTLHLSNTPVTKKHRDIGDELWEMKNSIR